MDLGERLERAIAAAQARGLQIDIGRPIREYENYRPHVDPPRRRAVGKDEAGKVVSIPGVLGAEGRQTRAGRRRDTNRHEALAYAAAQCDPLQLAAVLWCLGQDARSRSLLRAELLSIALEIKERRSWPKVIRRMECEVTGLQRCQHAYVTDLCTLALREGADPFTYRTEDARARWFGLSERHWRRAGLADGYAIVHSNLASWYENGWRAIAARVA